MRSFIDALFSPDMPFIRNALIAGILSAVLFGVLGSIITVRRISSLAGSISHAVLGGIGMALFLSSANIIPGFPPMAGAMIFALLAAVIIGFVSIRGILEINSDVQALGRQAKRAVNIVRIDAITLNRTIGSLQMILANTGGQACCPEYDYDGWAAAEIDKPGLRPTAPRGTGTSFRGKDPKTGESKSRLYYSVQGRKKDGGIFTAINLHGVQF